MKIINGQFPSIEQLSGQLAKPQANAPKEQQNGSSFADIFSAKKETVTHESDPIRFSKHASTRLTDINESLVLMDQLAFIVNVRNNTVITAMDQSEADENVFTNIDGAVIV